MSARYSRPACCSANASASRPATRATSSRSGPCSPPYATGMRWRRPGPSPSAGLRVRALEVRAGVGEGDGIRLVQHEQRRHGGHRLDDSRERPRVQRAVERAHAGARLGVGAVSPGTRGARGRPRGGSGARSRGQRAHVHPGVRERAAYRFRDRAGVRRVTMEAQRLGAPVAHDRDACAATASGIREDRVRQPSRPQRPVRLVARGRRTPRRRSAGLPPPRPRASRRSRPGRPGTARRPRAPRPVRPRARPSGRPPPGCRARRAASRARGASPCARANAERAPTW